MKTELQKLESQLIYLKLEKAETLNEILKEYNKFLEKYNKDIKEIYDRIELLKNSLNKVLKYLVGWRLNLHFFICCLLWLS